MSRRGRLAWLHRHGVLWSVQFAYMAEYRAEILLWALSGVLPFIMLAVWSQAAVPGVGLGSAALGRYFLSAFVVRQFTVAWVVWQFEEDTIQGRLSPFLLQPLHPFWRYVAAHQAEQATRLPFVAGLASLFLLLVPWAAWLPSPGRLGLVVLATALAFAVNFLVQSLIAVLCFWSERASALERLHTLAMLFLSGLMAPLEVFPPAVRQAAQWTPFPWIIHFPARLLAGAEVNVAGGLAALGAWLALLLPLTLLLWRAGVRRYAAMGA